MRHRVFIAINFPEKIKRELFSCQEEIERLFSSFQSESGGGIIRWVKKENLHLTLVFLGYISGQEVGEICKTAREIGRQHSPFSIRFNRVCYGPPKKMPPRPPKFLENLVVEESENKLSQKLWRPRMIWVEGERVKELSDLKTALENSLRDSGIRFEAGGREFRPHVTLGRIRTWEWKKIEPEERPQVEQEISLDFEAESIEVMESRLKRGGAEYTVLESIPLSK